MSPDTSVSTRSTAAWSQLESQPKQNEQASEYPSSNLTHGANTNFQPTHQDQVHQQQPTFLSAADYHNLPVSDSHAESIFGEYLTPDYSSDDHQAHPTPEIEDLVWQENYNDQSLSFVDQGNDPYAIDTSIDPEASLQSATSTDTKISSQHLPSPQLTATPTPPEHSGHSQQSSISSTGFSHNHAASSSQQQRSLAPINTDTSAQMVTESGALAASVMAPQSVSPVIRVSSHTRGDSPRRDNPGLSRSLSGNRAFRNTSEQHTQQSPSHNEKQSMLMPPTQPEEEEEEEEEDWEDEATERAGVAPNERNTEFIPSLKDMEEQQKRDDTITGVENWLANTNISDALPADTADRPSRSRFQRDRFRSRSTGTRNDAMGLPAFSDSHVPGPGALIDVESNYYYSDDEFDAASDVVANDTEPEDRPATPPTEFPPVESIENIAPDEDLPLQRQFIRRTPWQDPLRYPEPITDSRGHPESSNAAMILYERQAARFETASRAATWGTGRRASASDIGSIMNEGKTRHLSLSQKTRDRGASIMNTINRAHNKARELIPRRSNSNIKKNTSQGSAADGERTPSPEAGDHRSSSESNKPVIRRPSLNRKKSPSGHLTAVAATGSGVTREADTPKSPLLQAIKRVRSRSDVSKSPQTASPGLSELLAKSGGMPVPTLASPGRERHLSETSQSIPKVHDVNMQGTGVRMDLPVRDSNIIPTLEGFKTHARELNPRLPPYLIERIGQDQLRRYKRLVKAKVDHTRAVEVDQRCASGERCLGLGGEVKVLPPRTSIKDTGNSGAQFKVSNSGDSDVDESSFDGVVTPALFPDGIPLPPTKRLPAEFECPLCFQVKSFQKPSDWTKHVHEDVQPFSCTFPNCPEPKSFKRKADWVRHENERHRHLEWWQCNLHECSHICYRKDNFVQHLVREHKKKEPKVKSRGSSSSKAKGMNPSFNPIHQEEREFWNLVDSCRHESPTDPKQTPCQFCNNMCASWKKLSVHVGKHMEQIAMPVLEMAQARVVTKDTVISPIEPTILRNSASAGQNVSLTTDFRALSPYNVSATSNYQSSSAGQSPSQMQAYMSMDPAYGYNANVVHSAPMSASPYSAGPSFPSDSGYNNYGGYAGQQQYGTYGTHTATYPPAQLPHGNTQSRQHHPASVPRSQPMETGYMGMPMEGMSGGQYYEGQTFFSSPQMDRSYMHGFGGQMMPQNGMTTGGENASPMGHGTATMGNSRGMTDGYGYSQTGNTQQGYFQ